MTPSRPILLASGYEATLEAFGGVPMIPVDCDPFTAQSWLETLAGIWDKKNSGPRPLRLVGSGPPERSTPDPSP